MPTRLARLLALVAAAGAACCATSAPTMCDEIGLPAPAVTTILAAPNDTENTAWILRPDCALEIAPLAKAEYNVKNLKCSKRGIQHIASLPTATERLHIEENPIAEGSVFDLTNCTKLNHVILAWCNLTTVDHFKFPSAVTIFDFDGNHLQGIASGTIPTSVRTLYLSRNGLTSMDNFSLPSSVFSLNLQNNSFTSFNFTLPAGLGELQMEGNKQLRTIERMVMPNSLTIFNCPNCAIETFRGVQFSPSLSKLDLTGSRLKELEVQESDAAILKKLVFLGIADQKTCQDPNVTLRQLQPSLTACVISDESFGVKYLGQRPSPLPTTTPPPTSSLSSSKTAMIVVVAVVAVVAVMIAALAYRRWRKHSTTSVGNKYQDLSTAEAPTGGSSGAPHNAPPESVTNDIRNDEAIVAYRIAYDEVRIVRLIGKGGFGIIHLGRFRGRDVAVKQILPDRAKDMRVVRSFMDEIRLCVTLEHPNIVQFIGLMWSTLQDMAVVSEFMAGGDLHAVLERQPDSSPTEWFESSANLKAKSSVALDVIVALVYLHSFDLPIIHRDLKARNVLLNSDGDAKLSDFGTSREALLDETMTGEIGTVAWIAPEVLRGERYNEKVDIYSLGVLLVELDTARHPYRNEMRETGTGPSTNTQIALMVSTGKLAPSPSRQCPSGVAPLITMCLSYAPQDRPSAMEIHYELRKIVRAHSDYHL